MDGDSAMSDAGGDVFLLAACGCVTSNSADIAGKDLCEVFLAEESVLIASLFGGACESSSAGGFSAVLFADFEISRIE